MRCKPRKHGSCSKAFKISYIQLQWFPVDTRYRCDSIVSISLLSIKCKAEHAYSVFEIQIVDRKILISSKNRSMRLGESEDGVR